MNNRDSPHFCIHQEVVCYFCVYSSIIKTKKSIIIIISSNWKKKKIERTEFILQLEGSNSGNNFCLDEYFQYSQNEKVLLYIFILTKKYIFTLHCFKDCVPCLKKENSCHRYYLLRQKQIFFNYCSLLYVVKAIKLVHWSR